MSVRPFFPLCAVAILAASCSDAGEPDNYPPTAQIVRPGQDTTVIWPYSVEFEGRASDGDGRIVGHRWDFGDGNVENVWYPGLYSWAAAGIYTVSFQVTDNDGAVSPPAQVVVTVEEAPGIAPEPGPYFGNAGFGLLDFTVNDPGTAVTGISFIFEDWECGGGPRSGRIGAENPSGWPISEGDFLIETSFPAIELAMTVQGTFNENDAASGTWSGVSYGTTCTGDWNVGRQSPEIHVSVSADFNSTLRITGAKWLPGGLVTLEVDDGADGSVDFTATVRAQGGGGNFARFYDGEAPPFDVTEGGIVRMYDVLHDVSFAVLYVTLESVDAAADVVSGSAREGTLVGVGIDVPDSQVALPEIRMIVDASGTWSADFSGLYDITAGTDVWVAAGCPLIASDVPCYGYTTIGGTG